MSESRRSPDPPRRRPPSRRVSSAQTRGPRRRPAPEPKGKASQSIRDEFTYEDYIKAVGSDDKIIDHQDPDRLEKFADKVVALLAAIIDLAGKSKQLSQRIIRAAITGGRQFASGSAGAAKGLKEGRLKDTKPADLKRAPARIAQIGAKKLALSIGSVAVVAVLAISMFSRGDDNNVNGVLGSGTDGQAGSAQPDFEIVQSDTSDNDQTDPVRYDPTLGVASYVDTVDGNDVVVSQQPLNEEQAADPEKFISEVSVNLLAQGSFESNKGTVYFTMPPPDLATLGVENVEGGELVDHDQVVIFAHNNLLIFVRTNNTTIGADTWLAYVDSLQ